MLIRRKAAGSRALSPHASGQSTGMATEARIAMMATTVISSAIVKPDSQVEPLLIRPWRALRKWPKQPLRHGRS